MKDISVIFITVCVVNVLALDEIKHGEAEQDILKAHAAHQVAAVKYLLFREDCFESFFTRFDLTSDPTCMQFFSSKLIGYLIITGSVIYKVPQIAKILNNQSVEGLSRLSHYVGVVTVLQMTGQSLHLNLPFSVYGENIMVFV